MSSWVRVRFSCTEGDSRPIKWPPPGPFWESGTGPNDESIVVAFVRRSEQVREFWPDSGDLGFEQPCDRPTFSGRFACPDYWNEATCAMKEKADGT